MDKWKYRGYSGGENVDRIENGRVYEFIENLYDELKNHDGGYFPSKHDNYVFERASEVFSISIEDTQKIYEGFGKHVARLLELKLQRLPKKERQKRREEMLRNIMKNNRDLPFYELEGPPTEDIKSGLDTIDEEYSKVAELIGTNGWTIPGSMGLSKLNDLLDKEIIIEVLDPFFSDFYTSKKFKLMVKHVENSNMKSTQKELFRQCLEAYSCRNYLICTTALITILEGLLSEFGEDKKDIKMIKICRLHMEKTKADKKIINHLVWVSLFNFIKELYEKSSFDKNQPERINRHWILHGRTDKQVGEADCLRLFNAIYSLVTMLKYEDSK